MGKKIMRTGIVTCGVLFTLFALPVSAQDLKTGIEQLAEQIIKAIPEGRELRIAVVDFQNLLNVTSNLERFIANRLTTRLAQNKKFFVVERQRLGQILSELKFSMSDLVDPEKAKRLGHVVGVEALVVGTTADLGNQVDINVRVIEIDTSRMLLSALTTISKDQVVSQLIEAGQTVSTAPSVLGSARSTLPEPPPKKRTDSKHAVLRQANKDAVAELATQN